MAMWPPWRMRLLYVLAVLVPISVLLAALLPVVHRASRAARQKQHTNNLKQVGLALLNFHDTYERLPPAVRTDEAGRPLASWRFQIMPFVEATMIAADFDGRWYDLTNRWWCSLPNYVYCWSPDEALPTCLHTNLVAVSGPGTAFDDDRNTRLDEIDFDTILVIEIANSDTHWMEPGDLRIDEVPPSITQGFEGNGVHVLFADGSVWFLGADVPFHDLKKFFTIEGAKRYDREQVLRQYAQWSSQGRL